MRAVVGKCIAASSLFAQSGRYLECKGVWRRHPSLKSWGIFHLVLSGGGHWVVTLGLSLFVTSSLSSIQPNLRSLNFEMSPVDSRFSPEDQLLGLHTECPVSSELQLVCFCCNAHDQWSLSCSPIAQLHMKTGENVRKWSGVLRSAGELWEGASGSLWLSPTCGGWVRSKFSGVTELKPTLSPVRQASASEWLSWSVHTLKNDF